MMLLRVIVMWYLVSVTLAMVMLVLRYVWREHRFGWRRQRQGYGSISSAALAGLADAGQIQLDALRWPYVLGQILVDQILGDQPDLSRPGSPLVLQNPILADYSEHPAPVIFPITAWNALVPDNPITPDQPDHPVLVIPRIPNDPIRYDQWCATPARNLRPPDLFDRWCATPATDLRTIEEFAQDEAQNAVRAAAIYRTAAPPHWSPCHHGDRVLVRTDRMIEWYECQLCHERFKRPTGWFLDQGM